MNGKRVSLNSADMHNFCAKRVIRSYHFPLSGSRLASRAGIPHSICASYQPTVRRISGHNNGHSFTLIIHCSRFGYLEIEFIINQRTDFIIPLHILCFFSVCRSGANGWPRAKQTKNKNMFFYARFFLLMEPDSCETTYLFK